MTANKNCKHTICMYYHVCRQYEAKWCIWIMDCMYPDDLFDIDEVAKYNDIQVWRPET